MIDLSPEQTTLLDGAPGIDTSWSRELRLGATICEHARLLPEAEAANLEKCGFAVRRYGDYNLPPHLREHVVCELTARGFEERQRILRELEGSRDNDELTLATALGAGSPLLVKLDQLLRAAHDMHAELIGLRCMTMAVARVTDKRLADDMMVTYDALMLEEARIAELQTEGRKK